MKEKTKEKLRKVRSGSIKKTFRGFLSEYFIVGNPWRVRLGMAYNRYQHGNGRINIFKDVAIILGIGGVVSGVDFSFIPFWAFVIFGFLWIFGCYTIGYVDERWGFWKEEAKHISGTIDLVHKEMMEDIKEIKELCQKEYIQKKNVAE